MDDTGMSTTDVTLPQLWDDEAGPRARATDPDTSHLAADSNRNRELVEAHVLHLLRSVGPMNDFELTRAYFADPSSPNADPESPRKRRSDLTGLKLVEPTEERRPGRSNRTQIVFRAVAA